VRHPIRRDGRVGPSARRPDFYFHLQPGEPSMRLTLVLNVLLSIAVFAAVMIAGESLAHAQSCPAGTLYCDAGWCCPPGLNGATNVCCNDNPQSEGCTSNGVCGTTDGGNNDPTTCDGGSIPTQDTCGEAQCSCAAPCSSGGDCSSGCCVEGYCALPCTCAEGTEVLLYCGTNDETTLPRVGAKRPASWPPGRPTRSSSG